MARKDPAQVAADWDAALNAPGAQAVVVMVDNNDILMMMTGLDDEQVLSLLHRAVDTQITRMQGKSMDHGTVAVPAKK